uniref:McrB family protein n=1 Tax=Prevotella sp. TaxID=59823 RepID=UPI004025B4DF
MEHQMRNLPQIEDVEVADHTDILSTPIEPTDETTELDSREYAYMAAIKTKPFLILGGFSGTGKSLLVKSLAFTTCPCDGVLNTSETSPGNYLLVSVKPNWHDATDITGFRSSVNRNYYVTDFMRFLVKAKLHPNVPFFVCLDEMNLAPVEEYFADFLSVIESRKRKKDGTIVTDAIVPASVFNDKDYADDFDVFLKIGLKPINEVKDITEFTAKVKESDSDESEFFEQSWLVEELKRDGLTIPQNVIIIGTVNMDDTTNSFSRKVIDRAMTFETIVGTFDSSYFDSDVTLGYVKNYRKGDLFISDEVRATEMMEDGRFTLSDEEKNRIIGFINSVNSDLEGTPFKISYRILNETILLYRAKQKIVELMGEEEKKDGVEVNTDLNTIFDDILMQKVLPRIEGDFEKCDKCLVKLGDRAERMEWKQSSEKIEFMIKRFGKDHSGFTSFWN